MTRTYVIDDDPAVRASTAWLLGSIGHEVHTFATTHEFLTAYAEEEASTLILDLRLPGMTGLEFNRYLKHNGYRVPVIFMTAHGDVSTCATALRDGAFDFFEKPLPPQHLLERVNAAIASDSDALAALQRKRRAVTLVASLTAREREVMELMIAGEPTKAIASALCISARTVEVHRARVRAKLHTANLAEMAMIARNANDTPGPKQRAG
ncbi:FixJ family two-component response regulator [Microbacterium sp. BE35]|uniref:response regulator transcription factor n=1 Tax=Microbacterium sp. BE35 TaxID=2817773 RepID=UPI002861A61A|nr:response regulator [Microbacterium sp. BE35]MDR7188168.1 FixJ family two-component response regulator [Microbacterium sp. BE35]